MTGFSSISDYEHGVGHSRGWAVVAVVLGFVAVLLPLAFGIGVSFAVAWVIAFAGLAYIVFAFAAKGAGTFLLRLVLGIMYVVGGGYLLFHPQIALLTLTLMLAIFFLVEGIFELVVYFSHRWQRGSAWLLLDAVVSLLLAYFIGRPWPGSSAWAVGTIVGINLIFSGMSRLMYGRAARKSLVA